MTELSDTECASVRLLTLAVYPPEEWVDWPGQQIEWSKPEWCVRVYSQQGTLVSYLGLYLRKVEYNGRPVWVGGIGNVKTHPSSRRKGFGGLAIRRAIEFIEAQPYIEFALLVCEPQIMGYYARFGWKEFSGRLIVRQHGLVSAFTLDRVMTYEIRTSPVSGSIDLRGPPW